MARIEPSTYEPDVAIPPGDTVAEMLRELEISVFQFSEISGLTLEEIEELFDGDMEVSISLAETLSTCLNLPVTFWLNLERNYRLTLQRLKAKVQAVEGEAFSRKFPLKEVGLDWAADRLERSYESPWISVEERMPASEQHVIAFRDGDCENCYYSAPDGVWISATRPVSWDKGPSHWMPLPDPPDGST